MQAFSTQLLFSTKPLYLSGVWLGVELRTYTTKNMCSKWLDYVLRSS